MEKKAKKEVVEKVKSLRPRKKKTTVKESVAEIAEAVKEAVELVEEKVIETVEKTEEVINTVEEKVIEEKNSLLENIKNAGTRFVQRIFKSK